MIETLVLATDGSASVTRAVETAIDLAGRFEATVHAVYVIDEDEVTAAPPGVRDEFRAGLQAGAGDAFDRVRAAAAGDVVTAVRTGRPSREITAYATEHDADVVAMGTRGRHGEHRLLLGSVAEEVLRRSPVPVLGVRQLADGSGRS